MSKHPQTVDELFPSQWLRPDDLNGRSFTLTVSRVDFEELHNPRTNRKELKAILSFEKAQKRLPVNKTQSLAIADIAQSNVFADWPGTRISLVTGRTRQGKPTIDIKPAPAPAAAPIAKNDEAPAAADAALFDE